MKKLLLPIGMFIAGVFLAPMVKPMLDKILKKGETAPEETAEERKTI